MAYAITVAAERLIPILQWTRHFEPDFLVQTRTIQLFIVILCLKPACRTNELIQKQNLKEKKNYTFGTVKKII